MNTYKRVERRERARRTKIAAVDKFAGMTDSEVAEAIRGQDKFMRSEEWFILKAQTIAKYGCTCMACRKKIGRWGDINVDHIKPRKYWPELQNDPDNLQILCGACNKKKGNTMSDFR